MHNAYAVKTVRAVNAYTHQGKFVSEIQFAEPISPADINLSYINQTVQVEIPDAQLLKGTLNRSVNHERIKSLYTFEPEKNTVYSRIIQHKPFMADELKDNIEIEIKENIAFIRVSTPKAIAAVPAEVPAATKMTSIIVKPNELAISLPEKEDIKNLSVTEILDREISLPNVEKMVKKKDTINREPAIIKADAEKLKKIALKSESKKIDTDVTNKALPESEIPVLTNVKKQASTASGSFNKMIYSLLIIGIFALGITFFTKKWAKRHTKTMDTNKIRVLTQHHLGPKKSLSIIQVAGETILIGVTDQNINMIKTLSLLDEEIPELDPNESFSDSLSANMATDKALDSVQVSKPRKTKKSEDVDDFSLGDIKDLVSSRLKNMRSL